MRASVRASNDVALMGLTLELDNREAQALAKVVSREINDVDGPMEDDELDLLGELRVAALHYEEDRYNID